eukprot:TRINITY_DN84267_c0_g1_i1.p1 TRINITY_DN84267_c0_g1~~TRINITY_DN84267_c0_g1_i1.p1  ORF type:complete len:137 (-),score=13.50 TRINITY_DN84267_c0_g1_i1:278-688(-)
MATFAATALTVGGTAMILRQYYKAYAMSVSAQVGRSVYRKAGQDMNQKIVRQNIQALTNAEMRKFANKYPGSFYTTMTKEEAQLILGLEGQEVNRATITQAHRAVIMKNHADVGGSDYISTKINEAKALLTASLAE